MEAAVVVADSIIYCCILLFITPPRFVQNAGLELCTANDFCAAAVSLTFSH